MKKYQIRTVVGGGISAFVGGSVTTFEVRDSTTNDSAYYTLAGVDFGFGFKLASGGGPSSWTDFYSDKSIKDFHGYVIIKSASVNVGAGMSYIDLSFITGPASGLYIKGIGWSTGLGAFAGATHGWMKLRE